jgi:rRNA maturation endonuclease Nob1
MSLTIRKMIVLGLIGLIFLAGNILFVANWLAENGIEQKANWLREEFLTGTAIAVIIALLILLVNPKSGSSRAIGFARRCPVCDKRLIGNVNYCSECGSKV